MKHIYVYLTLLFLAVGNISLHAQWSPSTAMEGAPIVNDVIEFKNSIYINVHEVGVYRGTDNGSSWTPTNAHAQSLFSKFVVINDQLLLVSQSYISRSTDGVTFTNDAGIGALVYDVATDGTTLVAATYHGIYISRNGGTTWSRVTDPRTQMDISAVTVRGDVIIASSFGTIFKSTDGGSNWVEIITGRRQILQLAYQNNTVFMHDAFDGVFRSNDHGTTWQRVRSGLCWAFSVTPTHIYYVGDGTYAVSADQGSTWSESVDVLPRTLSIYTTFVGTSYIFAGTGGEGVYRKPLDSSAPWASSNTRLNAHIVNDIDVKDDVILAGTESAFVWKSRDEAQTWNRHIDDRTKYPARKFARMGSDLFLAAATIFRSENEGETWEEKKIEIPPGAPVGASDNIAVFRNKLYTHQNGDIYVSANRGDSWIKKTELTTEVIRTIFADDKHVYIGTSDGLFRLTDNDERLEKIDMGLGYQNIGEIAKLGSLLLVADLGNGLYKSADDGKSWIQIRSNSVRRVSVRNNDIYIAAYYGQIFHSADSGATWSDIKGNFPNSIVNTINFTSKHMLVGTYTDGLWSRPIGEIVPPHFYIPSPVSDSTFVSDQPIVIRVDQPIHIPGGGPVTEGDLEDLIDITTPAGTPANFTATLSDDLKTITITISDVHENTTYRINIAPVANEEGLETKGSSFVMRAITDAPPVVSDILIEMSQNASFSFTKELFTTKYSDPEGSPLVQVRMTALPINGTLKNGSGMMVLGGALTPAQLLTLTYTPAVDFVGIDQWSYDASDGTSYSNAAFITITVAPVTSVSERNSSLMLYPNPVDKALMIKMVNGRPIDQLTVMDMSGRRMAVTATMNDEMATVDFTEVPIGMYVLRISSGSQLYYEKIVRR